jgi:hypothetical protein
MTVCVLCKFSTIHWIPEQRNLLHMLSGIFAAVDNRYLFAIKYFSIYQRENIVKRLHVQNFVLQT